MNINIQSNIIPKMQMPSVASAPSRNALVELVLLTIVIGLFTWFLVLPKKADLKIRTVAYDEVKKNYESIAGDVSTLKELNLKLENNKENIQKLDEALPLRERTVVTQLLFSKIAQTSGVVVGDINIASPGDEVAAGNKELIKNPYAPQRKLKILPVNISVNGTMSQLLDLIKKLEDYGRLMDITSITMSVEQENKLDLRLNLNTYYFPPQ